jgi:hypothetical protein
MQNQKNRRKLTKQEKELMRDMKQKRALKDRQERMAMLKKSELHPDVACPMCGMTVFQPCVRIKFVQAKYSPGGKDDFMSQQLFVCMGRVKDEDGEDRLCGHLVNLRDKTTWIKAWEKGVPPDAD